MTNRTEKPGAWYRRSPAGKHGAGSQILRQCDRKANNDGLPAAVVGAERKPPQLLQEPPPPASDARIRCEEGGGRCVRGLGWRSQTVRLAATASLSRWTHQVGVSGGRRGKDTPTSNAIELSSLAEFDARVAVAS